MEIKGFVKTSLVDWDGKVASVIFLPFCNFDCGFCHSSELAKNSKKLPNIFLKQILDFLEKKVGWVDGVVITGGEPTLHKKGLVDLVKKIKNLGYKIKLDTNGSDPDLLKEMIDKKLIDYVAMDIKTSKEKYQLAINKKCDVSKVDQSVRLLLKNNISYEFRTTAVPGVVSKEDFERIGEWISGAKVYAIQQFRNIDVADKKFAKVKPYKKEELESFAGIIKNKVKKVKVRV